jgi:hypothetical protein
VFGGDWEGVALNTLCGCTAAATLTLETPEAELQALGLQLLSLTLGVPRAAALAGLLGLRTAQRRCGAHKGNVCGRAFTPHWEAVRLQVLLLATKHSECPASCWLISLDRKLEVGPGHDQSGAGGSSGREAMSH